MLDLRCVHRGGALLALLTLLGCEAGATDPSPDGGPTTRDAATDGRRPDGGLADGGRPDGGGLCADADRDGECDADDATCEIDGVPLACRRVAPKCGTGTVPEVREGCYTDRCLTWAECAALVVPDWNRNHAERPLGSDEPLLAPVPNTVRYFPGACTLRGVTLHLPEATVMNECVVCECGFFGGRCSARVGCPVEVCVLADGQVLAPGQSGDVDGCTRCECGPGGVASCARRAGDCPSDGCRLLGPSGEVNIVPFGKNLTSETSWCFCDEDAGLGRCEAFREYCEAPDSGRAFDQAERYPHPDGCGTCLCVSSIWDDYCDRRGCGD